MIEQSSSDVDIETSAGGIVEVVTSAGLATASPRKPIRTISYCNPQSRQSCAKKRGRRFLQLAGSVFTIAATIAGQRGREGNYGENDRCEYCFHCACDFQMQPCWSLQINGN